MIHCPVCLPPGSALTCAPAKRLAATATSGPMIHGSGTWLIAARTPPMRPMASPFRPGTNAFHVLIMRREPRASPRRSSAPWFCLRHIGSSRWRPAPAQSLDERDARGKALAQNRDCRSLVAEKGCLHYHHCQIVCGASAILIRRDRHRLARGLDRFVLDRGLLLEDPQRRKIVFYLLESVQHGLPVIRYAGVVSRNRLIGLGAAKPSVEERLGERRSDRPVAAWQREQVGDARVGKPACGRERQRRVKRRFGHAYLCVRSGRSPLRASNIRPPLEQL